MAVTTLLVFAAIMTGYFIMTKPGGRFPQDERIQKLWLRASNLSWGLTLYGVCILIFLDQIKVFSMTYQQLLAYLPMFMTYSMFIIRFILGRLGERSK